MKSINNLHIGQRIELFKILTDGNYFDRTLFIPDTIRPGTILTKKELWLEGIGQLKEGDYVRVLSNNGLLKGMWIKNIINKHNKPEVKPIGAFIVKSIKINT